LDLGLGLGTWTCRYIILYTLGRCVGNTWDLDSRLGLAAWTRGLDLRLGLDRYRFILGQDRYRFILGQDRYRFILGLGQDRYRFILVASGGM
jgi:hypothetical protein